MVAKSFFTLRWYLQETRENEARQPKPLSLGQLHGDVLLFLLEREIFVRAGGPRHGESSYTYTRSRSQRPSGFMVC